VIAATTLSNPPDEQGLYFSLSNFPIAWKINAASLIVAEIIINIKSLEHVSSSLLLCLGNNDRQW